MKNSYFCESCAHEVEEVHFADGWKCDSCLPRKCNWCNASCCEDNEVRYEDCANAHICRGCLRELNVMSIVNSIEE